MKTVTKIALCLAFAGTFGTASGQDYVVHFDGTNDYIDVGTSAGNGVRTVELWFKPDVTLNASSVNDYIALIARNDNTQDKEWGLYFSSLGAHDGELVFFCRQSGTLYEVYSNSTSWTAGTWYHVAGVIDGSTGMKMYVDCSLQTSTNAGNTAATQTDNTNYTAIGRWGNYGGRYFDGCIDNVRLWSGALTLNNLCDKCGGPAYTTGLLADWRMDDGTGTTASDDSGNNYDGTLTNGPAWELGSACPWVLELDGSNDYVDLGDVVGDSLRTIEMWFKPDGNINSGTLSGYVALIARDDNTQDKEFGLYFSNQSPNSGKLGFFCRQSGTLYEVFSNSSSWTAGTWYHVAGVIDGSNGMLMYINGSAQTDTEPTQTSATMSATEITALGRWGDENIRYFDGRIENVRLWSSARSSGDISTYQCTETGGSASGLVA
ncbi:MAG: patatin-like protein [Bacteroidetes bacterium]|nr:MAG: patatin-like protein [Bacteroidota bacterium]